MTELPDCQACGRCCGVFEIEVLPDDAVPVRFTRSVRRAMGWASWEADLGIRRMAVDEGRCRCLKGVFDERVSCTIYDKRPVACRDFKRGSSDCHDARETFFCWRGPVIPLSSR